MPQSIEQLLRESKELIERSRELRARSQRTAIVSESIMRRLDILRHDVNKRPSGMSAENKEIVHHLLDSRKNSRSRSMHINDGG